MKVVGHNIPKNRFIGSAFACMQYMMPFLSYRSGRERVADVARLYAQVIATGRLWTVGINPVYTLATTLPCLMPFNILLKYV